jgi:hypothetical protein
MIELFAWLIAFYFGMGCLTAILAAVAMHYKWMPKFDLSWSMWVHVIYAWPYALYAIILDVLIP